MKIKHLRIYYVRPSTYDDEGHVVRYWRGILPSNTLCCLKSLTCDVACSAELGQDVEVSVEIYDDAVQQIPKKRIMRQHRREDTRVIVGLAGVQTNQFARAMDLALEFRAADVPVMIGGFHVSGIMATLPELTPELQRLLDEGATLVRGEAEAPGLLAAILRDALNGGLKPIYESRCYPDISNASVPQPDKKYLRRFRCRNMGTIDTSRGCPFGCSFCSVINVQGRKMRHRSAACVLETIAMNYDRGVDFYFFTDDNFSRSPVWEEILDGLIEMRREGRAVSFMLQCDTKAHRIPRFAEKLEQAGCYMVFVGMESVNPENLRAMGKTQNDVSRYREMVDAWHRAKILVHVGYIIGLPFDTRESVRRDVEVLRNQVQVDEASFFMLTPLPGSQDHQEMVRGLVPIDADLNNYDSCHETFRHSRMAPGQWRAAYEDAWDSFYSKENIVNVLLRTPRERYWGMLWIFVWYRFCTIEKTHPMMTGLVRLKERKARRAGYPREGRIAYAWRRATELARTFRRYADLFFEFQEIWLLTRKPDDPRWATLADLRAKWAEAEQRLHESDLAGRCDAASQEVRAMLEAAAERMRQLASAGRRMNHGARKQLLRKAREIDAYLKGFEMQLPGWRRVVDAERYVSDSLLAGYEELAIRYVAQRRRFNAYRRDLIRRLKTGRILTADVSLMPRAILFELILGLRFGLTFISQL